MIDEVISAHVQKQREFFGSLARVAPNLKILSYTPGVSSPLFARTIFHFCSIVGLRHLQVLVIDSMSTSVHKADLFDLRYLRHLPSLRIVKLLDVNRVVNDDILLEILPALVHLEILYLSNEDQLTHCCEYDFDFDDHSESLFTSDRERESD